MMVAAKCGASPGVAQRVRQETLWPVGGARIQPWRARSRGHSTNRAIADVAPSWRRMAGASVHRRFPGSRIDPTARRSQTLLPYMVIVVTAGLVAYTARVLKTCWDMP